jgi:TolB-like protein
MKNMAASLGIADSDEKTAPTNRPAIYTDVLTASYTAADALSADLITRGGTAAATIMAASFVNINRLEESSTLGRLVSEQISSRMAQNGFRMLEMKLRQNSVYIKEGEGEFLLSRQLKEISQSHDSGLVVVGTYTVADRSIYVSARVVNADDSTIVTGYDFQLARNYQTDSLLAPPEAGGDSAENVTVTTVEQIPG